MQGSGERVPTRALRRPKPRDFGGELRAPVGGDARRGFEAPQRFARRQVPREAAGRGQVFDAVQPAVALFGVQESAVPQRLAGVGAVAPHHDLRDAIVGVPPHRVALLPSVEPEGRILVMQRVIVAAREEGAHDEPHARCRSRELPRQDHPRRAVNGEQLLLDFGSVLEAVPPARPGKQGERLEPALAVRGCDAGRVALRAQGEALAVTLDPRVAAAHQDIAPGGRRRSGEQQCVIAPRPHPSHGARGEAPEPVSFEPLGGVIHGTLLGSFWERVLQALRLRARARDPRCSGSRAPSIRSGGSRPHRAPSRRGSTR